MIKKYFSLLIVKPLNNILKNKQKKGLEKLENRSYVLKTVIF